MKSRAFIDLKPVLGGFLISGFKVELVREAVPGRGVCLFVKVQTKRGEMVLNTFHDGTAYAVKAEAVQDIEDAGAV